MKKLVLVVSMIATMAAASAFARTPAPGRLHVWSCRGHDVNVVIDYRMIDGRNEAWVTSAGASMRTKHVLVSAMTYRCLPNTRCIGGPEVYRNVDGEQAFELSIQTRPHFEAGQPATLEWENARHDLKCLRTR